ncbi:MAG: hypothetical protein FJW96_09615, partial [Actinobacteria bacterium]|nr:hypothetical protein [Actinomycetota bacterium]
MGLKQVVLTVRWRPSAPLEIPHRQDLNRVVAAAEKRSIRVVLAAYPYPPAELERGLGTPEEYATWLTALATAYPTVKQYVLLNEPNQPAFLRPQFDASGANLSAARAGALLAAGYDALKAIDPAIKVIGIGLSPRGNDRPKAKSNISTSPFRFLAALGAWYRESGRTKPLMDGLSFHPYPNAATDTLERGYGWPNAGFVNLDRIKQAFWDAFARTPQRTTVTGLKLYLDEVGWQVDTSGQLGYLGRENVKVTTEALQGTIYGALVRKGICDSSIAQINIFGFRDDPELTGFQAGLSRVDGTPRPARAAVASAISGTVCELGADSWRPERVGVIGVAEPVAQWSETELRLTLSAGEGAKAVACVLPGTVGAISARARLATRMDDPACFTRSVVPNARNNVLVVPVPTGGRQTVGVRIVADAAPKRSSSFALPR